MNEKRSSATVRSQRYQISSHKRSCPGSDKGQHSRIQQSAVELARAPALGARFKYDPFGRRIYKSSSSGTSTYAYDGNNLIEGTTSSGAAVARYSQTQNIECPRLCHFTQQCFWVNCADLYVRFFRESKRFLSVAIIRSAIRDENS